MPNDIIERATKAVRDITPECNLGKVVAVRGGWIRVAGFPDTCKLGDRATVMARGSHIRAEVIQLDAATVILTPEEAVEGVSVGDLVRLDIGFRFAPDVSWIGRVIDPDGQPLDGRPLLPGLHAHDLQNAPPHPYDRRPMGPRLDTTYAVLDTLLPIARGQRIGLFAGSGVGKTTLIAGLARHLQADVVVVGLVGERGRELKVFLDQELGPEGRARSVVVAATSDRAPQVRRRCAWAATAVAEHFRDLGLQVLLIIDSVTRFAEAHRELAVFAGEPAALRGFPASTGPTIAGLCERSGPGTHGTGDITAVYSVLVAGSDMEEPVADMLRGVLDGHVVLDRAIAESGRFPAVDILRSVSRSLPGAASQSENQVLKRARDVMSKLEKSELMVQSGLYAAGSDPALGAALAIQPALEDFLTLTGFASADDSYQALAAALAEPEA